MKSRLQNTLRRLFESAGINRGALHRNDRTGALHRAWGHVFTNQIDGDYVEFGVYQGDSFVESHKQYRTFKRWLVGQTTSPEVWRREVAARYINSRPIFRGLDTFQGMPENAEENATFAHGTFMSSHADVRSKCLRAEMKDCDFVLYPGLFCDTGALLASDLKKICILNVDCDIYDSARDALRIAEPFLQIGSVVLLDDFNAFAADNRKGERRAFREFCDNSSKKFEPWYPYMFSGQSFLCVEAD